ncbi:STAS/SEC14 domain-containing protein [Primorskyibacter sp. 2E233]|uniref:STAS/SEC14 domain-containing protein n=1 Tax=Primorskyibacter sp. 2E233 TaxID=3413431 RepID=UPI003BF074A7
MSNKGGPDQFGADPCCGLIKMIRGRLPGGRRIVEFQPYGQPAISDVIAALHRLQDDPGFESTMPALWDFREIDFADYSPSSCRNDAFFLNRFPNRKGIKRACVVGNELGYGHLRMFQEVVGGFGLDDMDKFFVCYSRDEAIAWLDG